MCLYKEINALLHRNSYFSVQFYQSWPCFSWNFGKWRFERIIPTQRCVKERTVSNCSKIFSKKHLTYNLTVKIWASLSQSLNYEGTFSKSIINFAKQKLLMAEQNWFMLVSLISAGVWDIIIQIFLNYENNSIN